MMNFFTDTVMNHLKRIQYSGCVLFVMLLMLSISGWAQQAAPSPAAAELSKFVNAPVNHYTGLPQIGLPLYSLPGRKMSLPIGLAYHARGIKVDDVASPVGIGWALQAGGSISRVVRGRPDELTGGYCERTPGEVANWDYYDRLDVATGDIDGEPDIFYYNMPGGAGRFVIDQGQAYTIPYQDVDISHDFCNDPDGSWILTDSQGFKYYFGESFSEHVERTTLEITSTEIENFTIPTTWHLSRIVGPDGVEEFSFDYFKNDQPVIDTTFAFTKSYLLVDECGSGLEDEVSFVLTESSHYPRYLQTITSGVASASFLYKNEERLDLENGKVLETVLVVGHEGVLGHHYSFKLNTGYWFSSNFPGDTPPNVNCTHANCRRLYLESIDQIGTDGSSIKLREFVYYNGNRLVPKKTGFKDYWGYMNYNETYDILISAGLSAHTVPLAEVDGEIYGFADYDPSPLEDYPISGLLRSISLSTGGMISYEYERNSGRVIGSNSQTEELGPGMRIKSVTLSPTNGLSEQSLTTYYDYEGGYFYKPTFGRKSTFYDPDNDHCEISQVHVSESSYTALYDMGGMDIGYQKVTERRGDGAKAEYRFSSFSDRPDDDPLVFKNFFERIQVPGQDPQDPPVWITEEREYPRAPTGPPFGNATYTGWQRGLPIEVKVFDTGGNVVSKSKTEYLYNTQVKNSIKGVKASKSGVNTLMVGEYNLISQPIYPQTTTTYAMDMDEPWDNIESTVNYVYEQEHNQLREQTTTGSDGAVYKTTYAYPFDFDYISNVGGGGGDPEATAVSLMIAKHMNAVPLEVVQYKDDKVIGARLQSYNFFNSNLDQVYPYQSFALELKSPLPVGEGSPRFSPLWVGYVASAPDVIVNTFFEDDQYGPAMTTVNAYDIYGNATSVSDNGLTTTDITYDTDTHSLVTSRTTNGMTTTYTHIPFVGISTETDPNEKTTTYEYDVFGRLQWVKDHHGDYLRKYEYHYVNEQP
ncbi:MAG: hypothetical protein RIF33_08415 [Cyclobacteriaceae bacterium]